MVDDRPEDTGSLPDSGRPKREPPTIDLKATDVSSETKGSAEAAPEPDAEAATARTETLEKTVAALRAELAPTRAQGDKLASAINDVKSAPRGDGAVSPDISGLDERIAKIESQIRTQGAEIAQQGSKLADAKPADDMPLRRLVSAGLLDVLVRIGAPYP